MPAAFIAAPPPGSARAARAAVLAPRLRFPQCAPGGRARCRRVLARVALPEARGSAECCAGSAGAGGDARLCDAPGGTRRRAILARGAACALALCAAAVVRPLAAAVAGPVVAAVAGPVAAAVAARTADPTGFVAGLTASFVLVLASEIGDKTFFISALLSMKYRRLLVLLGTMLALGAMTCISVGIGQVFHILPSSLNIGFPIDDYAAIALLLWFGFQNIRDGLAMRPDENEELQDAKVVVEGAEVIQKTSSVRVVSETASLVFVAEWGDKSMLATVALAAAKSPLGVIVGGISGHLIASIIAVVGGSLLGKYISERTARFVGGILFFIFALLTLLGLY